jgi:hypothetical protein
LGIEAPSDANLTLGIRASASNRTENGHYRRTQANGLHH